MSELPAIERFVSSTDKRIYRIPCEAFPNFIAYAYLVFDAGPLTLIDTGSGYGNCNQHVLAGLAAVRSEFGEPFRVEDIRRILLTHGHIDHFGGLAHLLEITGAEVGIHVLDRWVLTAYEERVIVATRALKTFLQRAGVEAELETMLMEMYGFSKKHVRSVKVDLTLADGQELDGLRFIHTPGHCPGQVCIAIGDVLISADHILSHITPHQAPESITAYTGLGHYLEALEKVRRLPGFDIALGGHERRSWTSTNGSTKSASAMNASWNGSWTRFANPPSRPPSATSPRACIRGPSASIPCWHWKKSAPTSSTCTSTGSCG